MSRKIVVFDSGFGGDLFADFIEEELPVLEVIRVIDWRHSEKIIRSKKEARQAAEEALRPYIGKVDVIVFANYLLSLSSLKYFRRKYKNQKFLGFQLCSPKGLSSKETLIISTKAACSSLAFKNFVRKLKAETKILNCDEWVQLIDDDELSNDAIKIKFSKLQGFSPRQIVLACTQLVDIKSSISNFFGPKAYIEDGYRVVLKNICHELKLRGLDGRKCR